MSSLAAALATGSMSGVGALVVGWTLQGWKERCQPRQRTPLFPPPLRVRRQLDAHSARTDGAESPSLSSRRDDVTIVGLGTRARVMVHLVIEVNHDQVHEVNPLRVLS